MLHRHSSGSWTKLSVVFPPPTSTLMTYLSPVPPQKNTSKTYGLFLNVLLHMALSSTPISASLVSMNWIFSVIILTNKVITPLPEKVQAIHDFPQPQIQRQLRQFIGLVNFNHRFLPHCADMMQPLHALLTSSKTKSQTLTWNDGALAAFNATKRALANASLLSYPKSDAPTSLMTDASDTAVGAVLQQYVNGTWCPISFFSRKMTPAETRYSTFDRELLAVYLAIKHFRHFFEGRYFHVLTDHKPLTFVLNTRTDRHSPRQAHQLDYISQFTSTICHVHGLDNVVADALSRIETNALLSGQPPTLDFTAMATTQATDPQIQALQSSPASTLVVEAIPLANSSNPLYCDTSTGKKRPLVPLVW